MEQVEIYKAILKAAQEGGYLDALPDIEEEIIREGQFYLTEANKAKEDGQKDKTITAILNLGTELGKQVDKDIFGAPIHQKFRGLPVPENPQHEPTDLPLDFTELGDKQIRKLSSEYNAYLVRARWALALAQNQLSAVTHLRDVSYRKSYLTWYEDLGQRGEKATDKILDAKAREDDNYITQDNLVRKHTEDVTSYKALVAIYEDDVDRLSREWTMRTEQDKREY